MTTFSQELQSLSPTALIELFVLDMTNTQSGGVLYFHAGTNNLRGPVIWQGQQYDPWPIQATGFDITTQGALPRPKLTVANTGGVFTGETEANNDLLDCRVIRKQTFARFLDAANFENGNPEADPNQHAEDEIWFIDQKTSANRYQIEWELASVFDLMGVQLPARQVLKSSCPWKYRGPECGYTGAYYDRFDQPTASASADACPKFLRSCKVRFGANNTLPFGGFPGATRYEV